MNSIVNHRSGKVSAVVIVVALLCLALFVSALLIHDSLNGTHLVRHGIMIIQTHRIVLGLLPPGMLG